MKNIGQFFKNLLKFFFVFFPKKFSEVSEEVIDESYDFFEGFLGEENNAHIEAKNFAEYEQKNKHKNPEIT